jgi:hypothetical protein
VSEARLYKLFKFARFVASDTDNNKILASGFLENDLFEKLKSIVDSIKKDQ